MNGFTEPRASGASERPGTHERVLTWEDGTAMLPLVGRIAADVRRQVERLARLGPERDRLESRRRTLAWPERARRYQLQEELTEAEKELADARAELEVLGVALLDAAAGLVGFPTVVNDRAAYFSWQPGEEGLGYWNFAGDTHRRPVPADWTRPPRERERRGKRKHDPRD
jgi:hypothetical protein